MDIVTEARKWVGTPYQHQAAVLGVGCDCVGLIRGVGVAVGRMPAELPDWSLFAAYGRVPNPTRMAEAMRTYLTPATREPAAGDILWLAWRKGLPMHLAICTGRTIIHSYSDVGRVVEHGFTAEWRARLHSVWEYRA